MTIVINYYQRGIAFVKIMITTDNLRKTFLGNQMLIHTLLWYEPIWLTAYSKEIQTKPIFGICPTDYY